MNLDNYSEDSEEQTEFEPESFDGFVGPRLLAPVWKVMLFFGIPPALGLITLLIVGVGATVLYTYGLQPIALDAPATESQPEAPKEVSVDDQISQLSFSTSNRNRYVVAGEIATLREKAKLVSERADLSVQQRSRLARTALRNEQIFIESQLQQSECSDEEFNSFEALAKSHISENDESLSELACFALARVRTLKFCNEPTETHGNHLVSGFREFSPGFQDSEIRISFMLERLMQVKQQQPKNSNIDYVITALGDLLAENQNSSIRKLANALTEDSRFLGLKLWDLNERIRQREYGSLQNLGDVLKEVEKDPEIDFTKWTHITKSCESLLSIGEYKKFEVAHDAISEMVVRLPDSCDFKSKLTEQIKKQKSRFELLGTSIELPKKSLSGRQIEVENRNILLVFLDRTQESTALGSELQGQSLDNYRPILIYRDDFSEADLETVYFMPLGVKVAAYESGSKLINSCFIDQYPYNIAINKQGKVVGINLSLWQAARAFEDTK